MKKHLFLLLAFFAGISLAIAQPKDNTNKNKNKTKDKDKNKTEKKEEKKEEAPEEKYELKGFRQLKWGAHLDSVYVSGARVNFVKSNQYSDKNRYAYFINDDDMSIGTVSLKSLYYVFNMNDRFIGVIMTGESKQLGEMKYILQNKFGTPEKEEDAVSGKQYYWTIDDVKISLINENVNQIFTLDFTSDFEAIESKRINRNVDDF